MLKRFALYALWALVILVALLAVYRVYLYVYPQAQVNFTQLKPTYFPAGTEISKVVLEVESVKTPIFGIPVDFALISSDVGIAVELKNGLVFMRKDTGFAYDACRQMAGVTCAIKQTPNGQKYEYSAELGASSEGQEPVVYDKIVGERVAFVQNGTFVGASFIYKNAQPLSEAEWGKYIDSFKSANYEPSAVRRYHPGP
jgi:hypothetical protein